MMANRWQCHTGWATIASTMASTRKAAAGRVRIKDVARKARVSVGTVSHVLSGRTKVSAPLRARVQKAIDALGYVPNFHAQRLRHGLSRVVGICLPHTSTAYLNALSETFEEIASRNGYGVMHVFSRHDPATELDRIKELIRYRVDGLILLPSPAPRRGARVRRPQGSAARHRRPPHPRPPLRPGDPRQPRGDARGGGAPDRARARAHPVRMPLAQPARHPASAGGARRRAQASRRSTPSASSSRTTTPSCATSSRVRCAASARPRRSW